MNEKNLNLKCDNLAGNKEVPPGFHQGPYEGLPLAYHLLLQSPILPSHHITHPGCVLCPVPNHLEPGHQGLGFYPSLCGGL